MRAVRLKRPNGTWSPPLFEESKLRKSVTLRLRPLDGPMTITEPGVGEGPERPKGDGGDHFVGRLLTEPVGTHLQLRNAAGKGIHGRVVECPPLPAKTSGSPGVDLLIGFLQQVYPNQFEIWGIYAYRYIAGTTTYTDHAYVSPGQFCGRAVDIHPDTMALGDEMKRAALAEPSIAQRLRYVLWRQSGHYDHEHWSFEDGGAPGSC